MATQRTFALDPEAPGWPEPFLGREARLLTACACCRSIRLSGSWVWENAAIRELRTFEWPEPPRFEYTTCDRCSAFVTDRRSRYDEHGRQLSSNGR